MDITIWGCRGSITTPGTDTIRYGGESTCIELRTDDGKIIIIDAGSGIRKLGNKLLKENVKEIILLITHAHWDHLAGFPFFKPAYYPDFTITLCGGLTAQNSILNYLKHQMEPPYFPVDFNVLKSKIITGCNCDHQTCQNRLAGAEKSIICDSIPLNHPNGGYGFKFKSGERSFVFLTDNEIRYHHEGGLPRRDYVNFCKDATLLIHDAHYLEKEYEKTRSWGHSTYQDAIDLAMEAGVKKLGLFHHDPERTDDDLEREIEWCINYIYRNGSSLECFACAEGMQLSI